MTQISKGDTFADGQQVTGARLNQLVDSSTLLAGAITDQTALTAATVAVDDGVLLSDTSASALRKATVGDILGSSLPVVASSVTAGSVVTSVVNAGANSDILVTPNDGVAVTGKAFASADGITATVTSTAHGLVAGMIVNITATVSAYSGQYQILVPTVDTFTYSVLPTTTASSGTCSYTRKASKRIAGNLVVSGESDIGGNETIGGNLRVVGNATINGDVNLNGDVNITGTIKYNGTAVFGIYEISQYTMTYTPTGGLKYTSPVFTKPSDEIWEFEVYGNFNAEYSTTGTGVFGFYKNDGTTLYYFVQSSNYESGAYGKWYVVAGTALTSETIKMITSGVQQQSGTLYLSIKKYKTA